MEESRAVLCNFEELVRGQGRGSKRRAGIYFQAGVWF